MNKLLVLIGSLVLVFCLPIGVYLSDDSRYPDPAIHQGGFKPFQPVFTGDEVSLLKASLNKREPVTITFGEPPFSKYWDPRNFTDATGGLMREDYLYSKGNVIGFGYDIEGYLYVTLWSGPPPPKTVYSIEALYAMLDEKARDMGIEDIPVKFEVFAAPPVLDLHA